MKNKYKYHYYRPMHVHQEMVANCELKEDGQREKWGRARRNPAKLDPWELERPHNFQKSWKKTRKIKYHEKGLRQHQYSTFVDNWSDEYELTDYLKKHGIPFRVVRKGRKECRIYYQYTKKEFAGYKEHYRILADGTKKLAYTIPIYKDVELEKPVRRTYWIHHTDGYEITWWSWKDIGVNYILTGV